MGIARNMRTKTVQKQFGVTGPKTPDILKTGNTFETHEPLTQQHSLTFQKDLKPWCHHCENLKPYTMECFRMSRNSYYTQYSHMFNTQLNSKHKNLSGEQNATHCQIHIMHKNLTLASHTYILDIRAVKHISHHYSNFCTITPSRCSSIKFIFPTILNACA